MTNLVRCEGKGSRPRDGDVFVARIGETTCPGRVVSTQAKAGPSMTAILTYVFQPVEEGWSPEGQREALAVSRLLVPPFLVNAKPWTQRYFCRVANLDFAAGERLEPHCFRDSRGWFFDEHGQRTDAPVEPVGPWGLQSVRTVDDMLSDALGIPRA